MTQACFTDCPAAVSAFLRGADRTIHIAVCWFSHPEIFRVLLEKCRAGVTVQLIVNFDQINFHPQGLPFHVLQEAGARVFGFSGPGLLHHKYAVADGDRLLTGSYNWTRTGHRDHVLEVHDPAISDQFLQTFETVQRECLSLEALKHTPLRQVSFAQLHRPVLWSSLDLRRRIAGGCGVWVTAFRPAEQFMWERCITAQRHWLREKLAHFWKQQQHWDEHAFRRCLAENSISRVTAIYCLKMHPGDILIAVLPPATVLGVGLVGSDPEPGDGVSYDVSRYVQWLRWPPERPSPDPMLCHSKVVLRRYRGSAMQVVAGLTPQSMH